jgi:hypothetical protein
MPFNYNSGGSIGTSENLNPIVAPAVNRYFYPRGVDSAASSSTGLQTRHATIQGIAYMPIKMSSTITVDRISMNCVSFNSCVNTWSYDVALYTHNATDEYPATKIADLGTFTWNPASTPLGVAQITISQTLTANTTYWLAVGVRTNVAFPGTDVLAGRTPIFPQLSGDYSMFRKYGVAGANSGTGGFTLVEQLPSYSGTLPASTTIANVQSQLSAFPRFAFRRSA